MLGCSDSNNVITDAVLTDYTHTISSLIHGSGTIRVNYNVGCTLGAIGKESVKFHDGNPMT